jgi:hypothetical protein
MKQTNILKQRFSKQYEILNELFGCDEIRNKQERLNDIFLKCEEAWEGNMLRLKNVEVKYLLIGEAAPWTEAGAVRYSGGKIGDVDVANLDNLLND